DDVLKAYIGGGIRLAEKLISISPEEYSLAIPLQGEALNYPMRTLRLAAYLAVAILASVELGDAPTATELGACLSRLRQTDSGGLCSPVTNDQMIELGAVWQAWVRLGLFDEAALCARSVIERMFLRRAFKLKGPV